MKPAIMLAAILLSVSFLLAGSSNQKGTREEGVYKIFLNGKELGTEKYWISVAAQSASSGSTLNFRNPYNDHQRIQLETKLEMTDRYVPRRYELKSDVDGKKGAVLGEFGPNEAMFTYSKDGAPQKQGVLVGKAFTVLDTNVFHHYVFLARLYDYNSGKEQQFEVVIPQEYDSGTLKVTELNKETIAVHGKKVQAHHLQVDSGSLRLDLWSDDAHVLYKISVPSKGLEVLRTS